MKFPLKVISLSLILLFLFLVIYIFVTNRKYKQNNSLPITVTPNNTYSTKEIVGQLFIWGIAGPTLSSESANLIERTSPGGVLLTGMYTTEQLQQMTKSIRAISPSIPLFIAIDQEGGTVKRLIDDSGLGGRDLGNLPNGDFCLSIYKRNRQLLRSGVNVNLNIIGDIGGKPNSYIWQRSYADTPYEVAQKVVNAIKCSAEMITVIKHFPGHGETVVNSHFQIPYIEKDRKLWEQEDAIPFFTAILNGIDIIMIGHLTYERIASEPASLSKSFHDILQNKNFNGLTITDDLGMLEASGYDLKQTLIAAINAGNDLLLVSTSTIDPQELYSYVLDQATRSAELMNTIQTHADNIIQFKAKNLH